MSDKPTMIDGEANPYEPASTTGDAAATNAISEADVEANATGRRVRHIVSAALVVLIGVVLAVDGIDAIRVWRHRVGRAVLAEHHSVLRRARRRFHRVEIMYLARALSRV